MTILAQRGILASNTKEGKMLSVTISSEDVKKYISPEISLSVINSDDNCVVSGETAIIDDLKERFTNDNVIYKEMRNTRAFNRKSRNNTVK